MSKAQDVIEEVKKAFIGKDELIKKVMLAILAGGHILIEDIPGVGKTTMALAFSKAMSLEYGRMQFTPDVLPSDIVGYSMYNKHTGQMEYQKGTVLCNLFLADELNRATSRTQSALLEAMEENQVTVDGVSHPTPQPFIVIATQNPFGASGTQLLPDSQIDRFMIRLSLGYPDPLQEFELLKRKHNGNMLKDVKGIININELLNMRREAQDTYVDNDIYCYIVNLVNATRDNHYIVQGASPRATLALSAMSKACAWFSGRDYVVPEDVQFVFNTTIEHRILYTPEAQNGIVNKQPVLLSILKDVVAPKIA
ncbi:MAG: MoxR family ATPase [Eubacteriales bacterium]|nr:MoxR family ATPase [Eubacteriales bacterium]